MKDKYDLGMLRKKPKRKNSRSKGNAFERKICSMLNHRFKSAEFSRSPGSGAFATSHTLPAHLQIYGDLITPLNFKYCIECKKGYNNLNLYSLYNDSSEIWKFIEQSEKDSEKCNKIPMVIFKQDRHPILTIVPIENAFDYKNLKYIDIHKNKTYRVYLFEEILKCWDSMWFDS